MSYTPDGSRTQIRVTSQYAGPVRIPPESFQPRMRKEINTRDTVNARFIESWNTNTPIQQSRLLQTTSNLNQNFDKYADAYRVPTNFGTSASSSGGSSSGGSGSGGSGSSPGPFTGNTRSQDEGSIIISQIADYMVAPNAPDPSIHYEQTTTYQFITSFMKIITAFDTNNGLYADAALQGAFPDKTGKLDYLNTAAEKEKNAIKAIMGATYIDPSFSGKVVADKIRILKNAALDVFCIQRKKNIDEILQKTYAGLDAVQPDSLDAVYQDMAPLSARQDVRDFRQSKPYDSSGPNLAQNPFFDRYDPTRDPRNMIREVRSAVYEPKEGGRGLQESERIRARTFTNRNTPESETPIALTQWYDLMRPKIDNPEVVYRGQNTIWKLGSAIE